MAEIGVVGPTSWGTTLAVLLARRGHRVALLTRTPQEADALARAGENRRFLPGLAFPPGLWLTASPAEAVGRAQMVVLAVPSASVRENARRIAPFLPRDAVLLHAVKGLEPGTALRISQVLAQEAPSHAERLGVLSGPNLAREIAQGLPSSTVVASPSPAVARWVQDALHTPAFRVYISRDVIGVELAGALKNIIAIGAGMCDGLGLGANAKSAFVTRGLAEITRLGVAAGADPLTFAGLAGIGDLMATCWSPLSRNRTVGERLARGQPLGEVLKGLGQVAEGVHTVPSALLLAQRYGVEMPIAQVTYQVLYEGLPIPKAIEALLGRSPKPEWPEGWGTLPREERENPC
ncbi:Glycerol-3-phosphate dehydrogenase [NAD(P)+] [bacterium HR23]|nr:Glycerol-3-phosphate dehydrogenase [NAD(P)+] [bacterium HR23]